MKMIECCDFPVRSDKVIQRKLGLHEIKIHYEDFTEEEWKEWKGTKLVQIKDELGEMEFYETKSGYIICIDMESGVIMKSSMKMDSHEFNALWTVEVCDNCAYPHRRG